MSQRNQHLGELPSGTANSAGNQRKDAPHDDRRLHVPAGDSKRVDELERSLRERSETVWRLLLQLRDAAEKLQDNPLATESRTRQNRPTDSCQLVGREAVADMPVCRIDVPDPCTQDGTLPETGLAVPETNRADLRRALIARDEWIIAIIRCLRMKYDSASRSLADDVGVAGEKREPIADLMKKHETDLSLLRAQIFRTQNQLRRLNDEKRRQQHPLHLSGRPGRWARVLGVDEVRHGDSTVDDRSSNPHDRTA